MSSYPLFEGLAARTAGVHLHPTCLPGPFGIGQIGREARAFVDFLKSAGFQHWQVCPLGPTGYADSPYQCFSSFAGNPYLIDLEALEDLQILKNLGPLRSLPRDRVDFGGLWEHHKSVMQHAYEAFAKNPAPVEALYGSYTLFKNTQARWLEPYATFRALKNHFLQKPFWEWPQPYQNFKAFEGFRQSSPSGLPSNSAFDHELECFCQYLFWSQWNALKQYANTQGVLIIGDLPIFVAHDSVEAWTQPELFDIDPQTSQLNTQAGVPPDYFSQKGQLWGNPLYTWEAHKSQNYAWWMDRIAHQLEAFDILRLDHFRAFDSYWAIPGQAETAIEGTWRRGPGLDFFKALKQRFFQKTFIAEDLGELTPSVHKLLKATGLPGMQVLQFAFSGDAANTHLPHNTHPNTVLYTSTHDNDTALGWYEKASEATQDYIRHYLRVDGRTLPWDLVRCAYASTARAIIIPLSDLLSLGSSARLNTPGQAQGNWQWRVDRHALKALEAHSSPYLLKLAQLYGRSTPPDPAE